MYSAESGKFCSRDPIGYVAGLNRYYAEMVLYLLDPRGTNALVFAAPDFNGISERAIQRCREKRDQRANAGDAASPTPLPNVRTSRDCSDSVKEKINESADPLIRQIREVLSAPAGACRMPPAICRCCPSGFGGFFSGGGAFNRLTICTDDEGTLPPNIEEILKHELTHAAQKCRGRYQGNNCDSSLKRELEAYVCGGSCEGFEECLMRAIGSSCWASCQSPDVFTPQRIEELHLWFTNSEATFCQFDQQGAGNEDNVDS